MPTIVHEEKEYTTEQEKAELFAYKLFNTFNENSDPAFDNEFKEIINDFVGKKFYRENAKGQNGKKFTPDELSEAIRKTNTKKSTDPFGLSNFLIKCTTEKYKLNLHDLFNRILEEKKIPPEWKTSQIKMIKKSAGDANSLNGYRPISVTGCLARLFERLILARLQKHLKKQKIIIKSQSGFRPNRSTT